MIKVCDAIMGSGKTCAAISYMNDHPRQRFIFVTPYLDEVKRIIDACPALHFAEPSKMRPEYHFSKTVHLADLIARGYNIATTHKAFGYMTSETLEFIREWDYTLILDECISVAELYDEKSLCNRADLRDAIALGYISLHDGEIAATDKSQSYSGNAFKTVLNRLRSQRLTVAGNLTEGTDDDDDVTTMVWTFPPEVITAFRDVIILTYLFRAQGMYYFLRAHGLRFRYIGVSCARDDDGTTKYSFANRGDYTPAYVSRIHELISIVDNDKMNCIGDKDCSLSLSWNQRHTASSNEMETLKRNMCNFFKHMCANVPARDKLWGTYKTAEKKIRGKGYTKAFLPFNTRATNAYRNCTCLAYPVNIYANVDEKRFLCRLCANGSGSSEYINFDDDAYALSVMLQWIWRSAIRDGKPVKLYLPSKRMRNLLINWMNSICPIGEVNASDDQKTMC